MKVFISWSGDKSKAVAQELREWLPYVINDVEPFVSSKDIEPGARWPTEIARRLENTAYGIICITRENQQSQWLNFEAGALAKAVDESRVVPLAIDLKPSDIEPPLGHFQAQEATEDGIHAIVRAINAACKPPLDSARLDNAFARWWSDLEPKLTAVEKARPAPAGDTRTVRDLAEETLDIVRRLARRDEPEMVMVDFSTIGPTKVGLSADRLAIGQRVNHPNFGVGVVTGLEPGGVVIILFGDTERKMMAEYAPLTLLD
jgi:hypothetical protein